jgi:acetyl-CoA C-acetyltransferase
LTFAGAPINNYSGQALAAMVHRLRDEPGRGLIHANGGYVTSHAMAVYGNEPPPAGRFRSGHPQEPVDAEPTRAADHQHVGSATVEAYSVIHDRAGSPEWALVALRTPDDARTWGRTTDPDLLSAMMVSEHAGQPAELAPDGTVRV